jgi:nucleoid DNA-binding protein
MANNLTKREIVLEIYEKTGFPQKQVQQTVQMSLDIILEALAAGRNVELRNFGVFEVQIRKARIGRNPNKPETDVIIPTRAVVKFKSGKVLKAQIKQLDLDKLQEQKARAPKPDADREDDEDEDENGPPPASA